ncbi:SMI1/KNR4 family protein [Paludisphaera soli]|uniref:SMI1/KNR4 family protein n=1 Tax=Paludisphaera soli TaxID=2712865 RepID=UPI0013ECB63F|nr:SMI1/KNR4 family protein [Paludisphaera soli]
MTDREALHRRFAERFHAGKRIRPAAESQVDAAEAVLGVLWPESYRRVALACGVLSTGSLLRLIAERDPGFSDVQEFLTPRQVVVETRRSGLEPAGAWVVIATDCSGNLFAFRDVPSSPPGPDDAPVWLFDHDEDSIAVEAPSFDAWLARFLAYVKASDARGAPCSRPSGGRLAG